MSKIISGLFLVIILVGGYFLVHNRVWPIEQVAISSVTPDTSVPPQTSTPLPQTQKLKESVLIDVPFVAQAPTGDWKNPREQDGCEEAASYMAMLWVKGEKPPQDAKEQEDILLELSDWEETQFGSFHDTSVEDTVSRLYTNFYHYANVKVEKNITADLIKNELSQGKIIQAPFDGRKLNNPFYTAGGPERHNLLIIGYDEKTQEFITNDNGTRHGKNYRYKYEILLNALRDYPTGDHLPITENKKEMIVISKSS